MRPIAALAFLLTGCPPGVLDTVDDTTEAPPERQDEVCDDGADNDLDGRVDCEDPSCMEVCLEDCGNGRDDDADGAIDCEDDECTGDTACPGYYTFTLATDLEYVMLISGPVVVDYVGYRGVMGMFGEVFLEIVPDAGGIEGTSCLGEVYAVPTHSYGYEGGTTYMPYAAPGSGDYMFRVSLDGDGQSLWWEGGCPLRALPAFYLGLTHGRRGITRRSPWGSWYAQYSGRVYTYTEYHDPQERLTYSYWYDAVQDHPVVWRAALPE
ncbi:MAG: hypothetical protein ABIO70_20170 [Pseudomonadota bacterium]